MNITLVSRSCPICGTAQEDAAVFAEARVDPKVLGAFAFASRKRPEYMHWRLLECRRCDLVYADPAPIPDELSALYRNASFDSSAEARYASRTYGRFLRSIARRLPDRVGAVDIGTGDGAFLHELLAAGFSDVIGIEPSAAPVAVAAPEVRALIRQEVFRPDSFPPNSLALISCFQTIEHLSDPLSMCVTAYRALKPGGALFLIGHNRRSLSARVLGFRSPIYDIEHLQLFSLSSVRKMLQAAGFAKVEAAPFWNAYPLHYWARLFPFPGWLKDRLIQMLKWPFFRRLILPLPAGNLAAIAYK